MKKILKIYFIFLAACCSLLFFFLIGTTLYLETGHARHLFQKIINQSIPGTISWADHSLSLLRGKAVFRHVILKGPEGDLLVRADKLAANLILTDLLENTLTFRHIALGNPDVRLFIQEDGNVNLAGAFVTPETPHEEPPYGDQEDTPFNVIIRHGTIKNGSFQYLSHAGNEILLSGLDMEIKNGDLLKETAQVSLQSLSGNTSIPGSLEIQEFQTNALATIESNKLSVQELRIISGGNSLSLEGRCDFSTGNIESSLSLIVNGDFLNKKINGIEDIGGHFILETTVQGQFTDPLVRAQLRGTGLSYQDIYFDHLDTHVDYSKGNLSVNRLAAGKGRSKLAVSGSARIMDEATQTLLATPVYTLTIHDSTLHLEDVTSGLKGELVANGLISGHGNKLSGNINVHGKHIDTGYQTIDGADLVLRLEDNKIFLDQGQMDITPEEEIRINGWATTDGKYYFQAVSKGVSFSSINMISDRKWDGEKLVFSLTGTGDITNPKINGDMEITGIKLNDRPIDPIPLTFDLSDMAARISGKENLDMDVALQLDTSDIEGRARFERIDLHSVFLSMGYEEVNGFLDGSVDISGNISSVDKIRAQIRINELATFWGSEELLRTSNQVITFKEGFISFSDVKLSLLKEGFMDLKGGADISGMIGLSANAKIPITIIEPFLDEVYDSEGYIVCTATIGGNFENPDVRADITLDKIGLSTPFLSERLRDANGRIQIAKDKILVENISGNFDQGKFNIDGELSLKDFQLYGSKINISGHAVPVTIPDEMDILLNAEVSATGNQDRSRVRGNITILDGVYFRDVNFNLLSLVPKRSRSQELESSSTHPEIFDTMALDIKVGYRNPFIIENNISFLEVKPDLHIKGSPNRLLMSGRASVDPGGVLKYQGREFEVTRGIIDFLNPYKIEPTLDIEGITTVREWTIFLNISGTPDNLSFALRSDPPEQNNDILYLLAFGKTIRESSDKSESMSTKQMIAAVMAEELGKNIKDSTVLDTVEVGYTKDSQSESGSEEVRVTVGKELSRRVAIKYGVETRDGQIVQRTTSEYKFLENFLLEAYNDTTGDYGAGLRYRLEFR